jgi:hypothetical protein
MRSYSFYKDGLSWYIDLPGYLEQGGDIGDLQMVDGADKMLDILSDAGTTAQLDISTAPFDGAEELTLIEKCDPLIGGGNYFFKNYNGQEIDQHLWLCRVTEFVFGDIPGKFYVRKTKN